MSRHTKFRWLAAAAVATAAPFAVVSTAAHAVPTAQARVATAAAKTPNRTVTAIVQFKPTFSERAATKLVRAHGGKVTSKVPFIHGLAVKLPAKQAKALAKEPKVVGLTLNSRVHSTGLDAAQLATSYPKTTRADKLWQRGITGAGVGVGVIDTGIAGDQPDFKDAGGNSRIVANVITSPGAKTPGDGFGHGTHVAGIIAGDSSHRAAGDPFKGKYVGMAPGANLIAIKASDDAGNSTVLDVINGIAFAVDHKAAYNIRVLNLSLATDTPQSYKTDPLDAAVEYAWQKGIVVVVASGNRGTAADAVQYAPANDPFVISVGGIDESANGGRGHRADWSSTGVTQDGIAKPEVVAPGAHMVSVLAPSSAFEVMCPNCSLGGQYFKAGGTSMAAPVVSGAVALLLQARPTLTPDQVKALLAGTDKPITGNAPGAGLIDVERALYTQTFQVPPVNVRVAKNLLIDYANRAGVDISRWTKSTWTSTTGQLSASWAKSTWSCGTCVAMGGAIDPQRSTWSKSTWSSAGEDASAEAAQYVQPAEEAADTGSLDAPVPTDAPAEPVTPETTPELVQ